MSTQKKPFFHKGVFKNVEHEKHPDFLKATVRAWWKSLSHRVLDKSFYHDWVTEHQSLAIVQQPTVTWIGHSTFLIQLQGFNILTDPIFFNLGLFFKRVTQPGIPLAGLPPIDLILISHNHWDHMHGPTLMALRDTVLSPQSTVLVPEGDQHWFLKRKFPRVKAFTWGMQETFHKAGAQDALKITFLPSWHWSRRGMFDLNKSLWGSWMIEGAGKAIYFAGDTAYADHFGEIGTAFSAIDVALLPIGPGEPKDMQHTHLDAAGAGQAFLDLNARHFIPMHWGTFYLGNDPFLAPIERLNCWWQEKMLEPERCHIFKIGQRKEW